MIQRIISFDRSIYCLELDKHILVLFIICVKHTIHLREV